jgi:hypothetical protein
MIILLRGSKIWYALLLTCELYDGQLYGVSVFHLCICDATNALAHFRHAGEVPRSQGSDTVGSEKLRL